MAKRPVQVERLRPSSSSVTPNIRIVDTYAPPAAADVRDYTKDSLANFIQNISPQAMQLTKQRQKANAEVQLAKIAEMDFSNGQGGYRSAAELEESGELVAQNPTVAMELNKALGSQIAKDSRATILKNWNEGIAKQGQDSLLARDPEQFMEWYDSQVTSVLQQHKNAFAGAGTRLGLESELASLESSLVAQHASQQPKYAKKLLDDAFNAQISLAFDEADPVLAAEKLSARMDRMGQEPTFSFSEINEKVTNYLGFRLDNAQSASEVNKYLEMARNVKLGSGTLEKTQLWKNTLVATATKASKRIQQLQYDKYIERTNGRALQSADYTEAYYQHQLTKPNQPFTYSGATSFMESNDLDAIRQSVERQIRQGKVKPVTNERYEVFLEHFSGMEPARATEEATQMITGTHPIFSGDNELSLEEKKVINTVAAQATNDPLKSLSEDFYKELNKDLAYQYGVADILGGAKVFKPEAKAAYERAEIVSQQMWLNIFANPALSLQYLSPETKQSLGEVPPSRLLTAIYTNSGYMAELKAGIIQKVAETAPVAPTSTSRASVTGLPGGEVTEVEIDGVVVPVR